MRGSEYEQFVFDKFERLFSDAVVTKNDHIQGYLSGLDREIDVSVRLRVGSEQLLYIAQCKDWKAPTDIKVLGEFSAVIQDVRAAKGFLLCTSGFAKSNHRYACTLGVDLITIEDVNSDKWRTEVQVPFVYVRKNNNYMVELEIAVTEALIEMNRDKELVIELTTRTGLTDNGGATIVRFQDYVSQNIEALKSTLVIGEARDFRQPNLHILIADMWVPCSEFYFTLLSVTKSYFLKYLAPDEYSQLRDHVRHTTLPLHVVLRNVGLAFDDTFVQYLGDTPPVFPGLFLEVEEWTPTEQAPVALSPPRV